jgi:hypothetical protein
MKTKYTWIIATNYLWSGSVKERFNTSHAKARFFMQITSNFKVIVSQVIEKSEQICKCELYVCALCSGKRSTEVLPYTN